MKKITSLIRWLPGCLIFFIHSCSHEQAKSNAAEYVNADSIKHLQAALAKLKSQIQSGDIVTRTGNDFTSQSLRMLNRRDQTFSHCSIASIEHDSLFIYHALGGEWNPDQRMLRQSFEEFTDGNENVAAGLFRFNISPLVKEKLLQNVQQLYKKKIKFDMDFDLKTDDKLYCAEFVYKSFLRASDSTVRFHHSFINSFEFIGVDDIILDPRSRKISVVNYRLY